MNTPEQIHILNDIEFRIIYSKRRTLGISVLPDSSVIVRAPSRAALKTIYKIVNDKTEWIKKHRDGYRNKETRKLNNVYDPGEKHLFRGRECELLLTESKKPFIHFGENTIEIGVENSIDKQLIRRMLYIGYKNEALKVFTEILSNVLKKHEDKMFQPTGLLIRTMKSRWGSCSKKGIITLSTELVKLSDIYIEYVIVHELCHLKHHNHGKDYYKLLSELFPDWKKVKNDLRKYIH